MTDYDSDSIPSSPKGKHSPKHSHKHSSTKIFTQPWGTTWRKAVVSLPRAVPDAVLHLTSPEGPQPIVIKISSRDRSHHIPLYVFIPPSSSSGSRTSIDSASSLGHHAKCPVLIDFHGGGFILGSCHEQAPFCARMARELGTVVISVDYRLGPAAKFPDAYLDAEDVVNALLHPLRPGYHELRNQINHALTKISRPRIELDTTRIALSGFSSGGNLAMNLVLSVASSPGQIRLEKDWPCPFEPRHRNPIPVLLFYPSLDTRLLPHERPLPSNMKAPTGFLASLNLESGLMPSYLPKHLTTHPRASPALVDINQDAPESSRPSSSPSHYPPSETLETLDKTTRIVGTGTLHPQAKFVMILPELDTLSESNEAWISKMQEEGRSDDVIVERIGGVLHGWTQFPDTMLSEEQRTKKNKAFEKTIDFVRDLWYT